jgi:hypothetical protein
VESSAAEWPRRGWRLWLAAAWIFGCAAYYYVQFTVAFVHENESALRRAFPRAAETFLSRPAGR